MPPVPIAAQAQITTPPPAARRYRFGKFQGWVAVLFGAFALWMTWEMARRHSDPWIVGGSLEYALLFGLLGLGLIKKRGFSLVLLLLTLVVGIAGELISDDVIWRIWQAAFWGIPAVVYYPKRLKEFRWP